MSFRRYISSTVRDAMARVRRELGADAVILSNRRLGPGRIEIVAAASEAMQALVEQADRPAAPQAVAPAPVPREAVHETGESFQDFIRRQSALAAPRPREEATDAPAPALRPREARRTEPALVRTGVAMYHEVAQARAPADAAPLVARAEPAPAPAVFRRREARGANGTARPVRLAKAEPAAPMPPRAAPTSTPVPDPAPASPQTIAAPIAEAAPKISSAAAAAPTPLTVPAAAAAAPAEPPAAAPVPDVQVMSELRSLRAVLSDRIAHLEQNISSMGSGNAASGAQRSPAMTRVMTRLLMSGFSPELARRFGAHAPDTRESEAIDTWMHKVLTTNLRCASAVEGLMETQGAVALVGPTGVGKTTTVAKLAARFAVRYGATQLGLVTLDSYRMGAHDQLRSYSRILGVPMHIAQDSATLGELLSSLQGKRMVLIDTCGLSQRDERMREMLAILNSARFGAQPVRPVLLLNAASHSETLDEVARAWNAQDAAGAILTKLDEAARIGGAVDCLLRYKLMLYGLTNGQRVPEDWHPAGASLIAHVALKPSSSPFALAGDEAQAWAGQAQGSVHA